MATAEYSKQHKTKLITAQKQNKAKILVKVQSCSIDTPSKIPRDLQRVFEPLTQSIVARRTAKRA